MRQRLAQFSVGAAGYSALEVLGAGTRTGQWPCWAALPVRALRHCAQLCAQKIVFQAALGTAFITAAEFATGLVVNRWLGWAVGLYKRGGGTFWAGVPAVQLFTGSACAAACSGHCGLCGAIWRAG